MAGLCSKKAPGGGKRPTNEPDPEMSSVTCRWLTNCFTCCAVLGVLLAAGVAFALQNPVAVEAMSSLPLGVMLNGWEDFDFDDIPDLTGKTVFVTGANTGLGFSTAKYLAQNGARTMMGCRSMKRCSNAKSEIEKSCADLGKECQIEMWIVDLESLQSVTSFVDRFREKETKLDILILNAGLINHKFEISKTGVERTMSINHIGHSALTFGILDLVAKAGEETGDARIVFVASGASRHGVRLGDRSVGDIEDRINVPEDPYSSFAAYGRTKLANILFAKSLSEKLVESGIKNVWVNSIHPGMVYTEFARDVPMPKFIMKTLQELLRTFKIMFDSDTGALTQIRAAVDPELAQDKYRGTYFVPIGHPTNDEVWPLRADKALRDELWTWTVYTLSRNGYLCDGVAVLKNDADTRNMLLPGDPAEAAARAEKEWLEMGGNLEDVEVQMERA